VVIGLSWSVHLTTKCDVIASYMIDGFGAVPVVDEKYKLLGMISEHDLLAALDDGHKLVFHGRVSKRHAIVYKSAVIG
jgi:CBS domain-containing protein